MSTGVKIALLVGAGLVVTVGIEAVIALPGKFWAALTGPVTEAVAAVGQAEQPLAQVATTPGDNQAGQPIFF